MESRLADFLKSGKDWERKPTTVPGVFVLRMPPFRGVPARLAVELNPVDDAGRPTKKRGGQVEQADYTQFTSANPVFCFFNAIFDRLRYA